MNKIIFYSFVTLVVISVIYIIRMFFFVANFSKIYPPLKVYTYTDNSDSLRACIADCNFYNDELVIADYDSLIIQNGIIYYYDIILKNEFAWRIYQIGVSEDKESDTVVLKILSAGDYNSKERYNPKNKELNQDLIDSFEKNILKKVPCLRSVKT